ncbi:MAG TPA: hypothetical protein VM370_07345 [Candidatus Thermoplasmatota archaeon]|nr:hypothetical protein [Candidatus Thermoplasmatota archaeon]
MRVRIFLGILILALPFAALPASASCNVATVNESPDINYTTVCLLDEGNTYDDTTQRADHDYLAHVSHAVEVDPVFDYAHANADRGTWVYDDGEVRHEREWTTIGAGAWEGARGLAGTGAQTELAQREQTAGEDAGGACSSYVGRSSCFGASGWVTVQDVASVGVGTYYTQTGTGDTCQESAEVDVDAVVTFVPVTTAPQDCTTELPWLYDSALFDLPAQP